jgi:hypothetical protein
LEEPANPTEIHDFFEESNEDVEISVFDESNEDEEISVPEVSTYRDFIPKAPAYKWLIANLRREFILTPAESNYMEAIRRTIIDFLPSHKISRKNSTVAYRTTFDIE